MSDAQTNERRAYYKRALEHAQAKLDSYRKLPRLDTLTNRFSRSGWCCSLKGSSSWVATLPICRGTRGMCRKAASADD